MNTTPSENTSASSTQWSHWKLEHDGAGIAWLGLDKHDSAVNVLSGDVLREFEDVISVLEARPPAGLILFSGKDNGFIAGADINEFPRLQSERQAYELTRRGHRLFARLESLPCRCVVFINGFALGGGLELALACDWRIAVDEDRPTLGLPEVQLGLHPGFGGTVRSVRLLGVRGAMALMLTGQSLTPAKARSIKLLDGLTSHEDWRDTARAFVVKAPINRRPPLLDRILALKPLRGMVARFLRRQVATRAREQHYPAPYAMIDLWRRYGGRGDAAYDAEARSFARLVESETSRNLVRVYFLQERLKRTAFTKGSRVEHVHVIGAGIMGGDIAAWCALRGLRVTLQDRELKYVEPALARADELFTKRTSDPDTRAAAGSRLVADIKGDGIASADIVIEAIFEDAEVKRTLYEQVEPRMKKNALLATNTSSIPLEELASCLNDPARLIGLHFFNPVAKLPLVEVVGAQTSAPEALGRGLSFTRQIGKLPVPCRSHPGFLVNRILAPYMAEAMELAREGVSLSQIDRVAVEFGMPMGPIELADSVGLDVALHVARILAPVIGREVAPELEKLVEAGHLGKKSGRGFYAYRGKKPQRTGKDRKYPSEAIQDRLMFAFINEAAQCIHDHVVEDADLVDAGVIFGTGFAPFRGGPIHYAKNLGIGRVVEKLQTLNTQYGARFSPSPAWQKLAD
jgi:3-hydroxyacyl-CoA dehydrogenase/enoyl-CoA hydratase/3-hydroxybutyryl-CoA epimerase